MQDNYLTAADIPTGGGVLAVVIVDLGSATDFEPDVPWRIASFVAGAEFVQIEGADARVVRQVTELLDHHLAGLAVIA